jgi:hypothetical protein
MTEFEIFFPWEFFTTRGSILFEKSVINICQFVPISVKKYTFSMYEIIFDRNGANAYVKNLRVLSQRKIRET